MADLLCVEHSIMPAVANVQSDQRRLSILLRNELLYAPTPSYLERVQSSLVIDESKRKELLIQVYDVSVTVVLRNCVFGEYRSGVNWCIFLSGIMPGRTTEERCLPTGGKSLRSLPFETSTCF